ncbi:Altered inheritance of mitochondria protein 6 [Coniothyrium glycines]
MALRRRNGVHSDGPLGRVKLPSDEKKKRNSFRLRKSHIAKFCVILPLLVAMVLGTIYLISVFLGYIPAFLDSPSTFLDWSKSGQPNADLASHLLDITRDVKPVPCHSHNDYWRRVPLYDALHRGCTGVEADVWLVEDDLLVGHSTRALTPDKTFRSMYVDPLRKMLDHKNEQMDVKRSLVGKSGIFDVAPTQTLVLLVDFKNNGRDIFPVVSRHLDVLRGRGYLTYFDGVSTVQGPITVVATGNAPFDLITANSTYRDIFFDAPLERLYEEPSKPSGFIDADEHDTAKVIARGGQGTVGTTPSSHFDSTNSYYASVNFGRSIGWLWFGRISPKQMKIIRGQIQGAHRRGLKARYWSAPKWPVSLRNKVWNMFIEEGVDYLNGDDLSGMTSLDWTLRRNSELLE